MTPDDLAYEARREARIARCQWWIGWAVDYGDDPEFVQLQTVLQDAVDQMKEDRP